MASAFADITFTPSVKAAQSLYGSREANRGFELSENTGNELGEHEAEFIAQRDSFYQATVSESGWPYVQHRGGPVGFLKVLDERTIGFADFRGNRQYLSVGNLNADERISLILMDYPNRRRLKLWGKARIVHERDYPELIAQLEVLTYRAQIERGIIIHIEAIEWNCPQHITPRYSEAQLESILAPVLAENQQLKAQASQSADTPLAHLGQGELELVIASVKQLTPRIKAFELRHPDGKDLPAIAAGAHLCVPVRLNNGELSERNYSICSHPLRRDVYEIAVLRAENGSGGSDAVHEQFQLGLHLHCSLPQNNFALHRDCSPAVLIAGGIGITAIKAMAHSLQAEHRDFQLHYAARHHLEAAYLNELLFEFNEHLTFYSSAQHNRLDVTALLSDAPSSTVFYVCGTHRLIDAVTTAAQSLAIHSDRIQIERFTAATHTGNKAIDVELRRSKKTLHVSAEQSVLDAIRVVGVNVPFDCRVGHCGTCAVKVLEGTPEHRDEAFTNAERERSGLMCLCVSRASSARLVLDL